MYMMKMMASNAYAGHLHDRNLIFIIYIICKINVVCANCKYAVTRKMYCHSYIFDWSFVHFSLVIRTFLFGHSSVIRRSFENFEWRVTFSNDSTFFLVYVQILCKMYEWRKRMTKTSDTKDKCGQLHNMIQ